MFCQNCGTKLDDGTVFCPNCGTKIEDVNVAATQSGYTDAGRGTATNEAYSFANVQPNANVGASAATGATVADEEQLENAFITGNPSGNAGIGSSFLHYKKSFAAFRAGSSTQWNWAAFWVGPYNLAYRRQYLLAAIFAVISLIPIISGIISGCIADKSLYNKFTTQKNIAISSFPNDIEQQKVYMAHNGGTKTSAVWIFIVIYAVVVAIIKAMFS